MSILAMITTVIKFLPEFISLIKWVNGKVESGVEAATIKKDMTAITKAFSSDNTAQQAAGALDDIFKN